MIGFMFVGVLGWKRRELGDEGGTVDVWFWS